MLQTRKSHVVFVNPTTSYEINLSKDQLLAGIEIEEHIVAEVVRWNLIYNQYFSEEEKSCFQIVFSYYFSFFCIRCKVTMNSWLQRHLNDLFVGGNNYKLIVKLQCHTFAVY